MIYPGAIAGNIGALLRLIQEEKAASPAALPPETAVTSPLRGVVQEPLRSPEAPGGTRVVSMRPEGVTPQGPTAAPTVVPAARPVAPVAPVAPAGQPGVTGPVSAPSPASSSQPSVSGVSAQAPAIATKVMPTMSPAIQSAITATQNLMKYLNVPRRSGVGPLIVPGPTPTPAPPSQKKNRWVGYTA